MKCPLSTLLIQMSTSFAFRLSIASALLLASGPALASREGAGIGEGLVVLGLIVVGAIALTLLASLVAGGMLAVRRGRRAGRGMLVGLAVGLGGWIALALALYLVFLFPIDVRHWREAREEAAITQWLLPLDRMQPGQLGATLAQLRESQPPYFYASARLAGALLTVLPRGQIPARAEDIAALRAFVASKPQLVFFDTDSQLEGLAGWMQWRYSIDEAARTCNADSECLASYARFLFADCEKHFDACVRDVRIDELSRVMERLQGDASMPLVSILHGLRGKLVLADLRSGTVRAQMTVLLQPPPEGYQYGFDDRLAATLIPSLQRMPASLTQDDRAALEEFVADVRAGKRAPQSDPCLRSPGSCGNSVSALRGAIVWAYAGPAITTAVTECGGDNSVGCAMAYAEALTTHCAAHVSECRAAANPTDLQRLIDAIGPPQNSYKQEIVADLGKLGEAWTR